MANMTYRELADLINSLSEEQQNTTVTVYDPAPDEFFPAYNFITTGEAFGTDVLDEDHPVILINQYD